MWIISLAAGKKPLAWAAFIILLAVALLMFTGFARWLGAPGTDPALLLPGPSALDGSDPAVGPGPAGVRPWIAAIRPPVGDQD